MEIDDYGRIYGVDEEIDLMDALGNFICKVINAGAC